MRWATLLHFKVHKNCPLLDLTGCIRLLIHVFDSHLVTLHLCDHVCPSRSLLVYIIGPISAPCTINDPGPIPDPFDPRFWFIIQSSTDHDYVVLPSRSLSVIANRRVPQPHCNTTQLTDVSDCDSVALHLVCRSRGLAV